MIMFRRYSPYFYPRPPRGGRRQARMRPLSCGISIHALREEGDLDTMQQCQAETHFYPRPPRGGRPNILHDVALAQLISIHALREEGDAKSVAHFPHCFDFYPRPPRGGRPDGNRHPTADPQFLSTPSARRATASRRRRGIIQGNFYPRPPRGGRQAEQVYTLVAGLFLSTPSARRATAKTEKNISAFVSL